MSCDYVNFSLVHQIHSPNSCATSWYAPLPGSWNVKPYQPSHIETKRSHIYYSRPSSWYPTRSGMLAMKHRGMCYLSLTACSNSFTCQHLGRTSVSVLVMICVMHQASNTSVATSTFHDALLRSCLHDKAKHALKQVQACSLYIRHHSSDVYLGMSMVQNGSSYLMY